MDACLPTTTKPFGARLLLNMTRPKEYDTFNPDPDTLERGQAFGAWFRRAVAGSGSNIAQIAVKMGLKRQSLYPYRDDCIASDGRFRRPTIGTIRAFAEVTGTNADEGIAAIQGERPRQFTVPAALSELSPDAQQALAAAIRMIAPSDIAYIPIVGHVAAGSNGDSLGENGEKLPVLKSSVGKYDPASLFAVRVAGDCMEGAHILDGDMLVCRRSQSATSGQVVIVGDGDDVIAKRYIEDENGRRLETQPSGTEPERAEVGVGARIIGVMVALQRNE